MHVSTFFTEEEVCKVVFQIDNKSKDLLRVFKEFHYSGVINQNTNATFITYQGSPIS